MADEIDLAGAVGGPEVDGEDIVGGFNFTGGSGLAGFITPRRGTRGHREGEKHT